jgi:pimeloyl-ACP methyl ester carboxylesterase
MTTTSTTNVLSADGTSIALDRRGEGRTLILVNGAGAYSAFNPATSLATMLAGDFTVITYDRRGRGLSRDTLPYSVEREVEDIAALIDHHGDEAFLYGGSSGGLLVLQAAAAGLAIPRLAVFEPPFGFDEVTDAGFTASLAALVDESRRSAAVEFFYDGIGVPPEVLSGMAPADREALEAVAHTLVYDCLVSEAITIETLQAVTAPTLVIASHDTSAEIAGWAEMVAEVLPNGTHVSLPGEWHQVADKDIARQLTAFFLG